METSHKQTLPEQFSMATFERNLAALAHVDEALAQRLCLPVNGRHIHFLENGRICYQRNRTLLPFVINREDLAETLGDMGRGRNAGCPVSPAR